MQNPVEGSEAMSLGALRMIADLPGYAVEIYDERQQTQTNAILDQYQGDYYNAARQTTASDLSLGLEVLGAVPLPAGRVGVLKRLDDAAPAPLNNEVFDLLSQGRPTTIIKSENYVENITLPPQVDSSTIITDPSRLLANPAKDPITGKIDPNYLAPESSSHSIVTYPAPEGMRVNMAVHARQIDPATGQVMLNRIGGFTTKDNITSVEQVHTDLAVKSPDWGPEKTHVQEFEVRPGTRVQESTVGPQIGSDGKYYEGGGNQVEPLVPKSERSNILIPIGEARPLPKKKEDVHE